MLRIKSTLKAKSPIIMCVMAMSAAAVLGKSSGILSGDTGNCFRPEAI